MPYSLFNVLWGIHTCSREVYATNKPANSNVDRQGAVTYPILAMI